MIQVPGWGSGANYVLRSNAPKVVPARRNHENRVAGIRGALREMRQSVPRIAPVAARLMGSRCSSASVVEWEWLLRMKTPFGGKQKNLSMALPMVHGTIMRLPIVRTF